MPYYAGKSIKTLYYNSYLIVRLHCVVHITHSTHFRTTPRTALIVLHILRTYITKSSYGPGLTYVLEFLFYSVGKQFDRFWYIFNH